MIWNDIFKILTTLDDVKTTLDQWDDTSEYTVSSNYSTMTGTMTTTSPIDVTFSYDSDSVESSYIAGVNEKVDDIGARLNNIEKALGIPPKLDRNKELEEEYPHIKEIAEKYEQEVEKHMTLKLLTPDLPQ